MTSTRIALLKSEGFTLTREYLVMWMPLAEFSQDLPSNPHVRIVVVDPLRDENALRTLTALENAAFVEHFNYRPTAEEEYRS